MPFPPGFPFRPGERRTAGPGAHRTMRGSRAGAVRRLHDSGRTGWWWWIGFVPVVGGIVLLVFYLLPGTPGPNRYNVTR